jgi:hypothetical protein
MNPRLKVKSLENYGSTINGLQIKGGSSDLDMTFIVDEGNAYYSEILKESAKLLGDMDAGMEFKNCKVINIKVSKRTFGDILDF